jgi:hypothetical protein
MTERPILFNAPMVRALLSGSKTQTRRICKSQPYSNGYKWDGNDFLCHNDYLPPSAMLMDCGGKSLYTTSDVEGLESECPYGQPGDRLWVKEDWQGLHKYNGTKIADIQVDDRRWVNYPASGNIWDAQRRAARFMPRWASRILLEIVSVRVERLNDISDEDARAEGVLWDPMGWMDYAHNDGRRKSSSRQSYQTLWEYINGPGSWAANPWVWCISFRRITKDSK